MLLLIKLIFLWKFAFLEMHAYILYHKRKNLSSVGCPANKNLLMGYECKKAVFCRIFGSEKQLFDYE